MIWELDSRRAKMERLDKEKVHNYGCEGPSSLMEYHTVVQSQM